MLKIEVFMSTPFPYVCKVSQFRALAKKKPFEKVPVNEI